MLTEKLLAKLSEWQEGDGPLEATLTLADLPWQIDVKAERVDSIGARFTRITATRSVPLPEDADLEEAHARKVAQRVSGLQESLALVEMDRVRHIAMLRSAKPSVRGEQLFYYQVMFHGRDHVIVERYTANRTGPANRQTIPFALTHEVAAQFIADLLVDA